MKKFILSFIIFFFLLTSFTGRVKSVECGDQLPSNENDLKQYIDSCQAKISNLKGQQATLAAAINYFQTQINLTRARINSTQYQLHQLELEITDLSTKIDSLNLSLNDLSKIFAQRVRQAYIRSKTYSPFYYLLLPRGVDGFLARYKYLQKVQHHDQEVMINLEKSRLDYDQQKQLKQEKQQQIQQLQAQLQIQQQTLASQKQAKDKLLRDTKNSELRYQQLLSQAQAQLAAFSHFVSSQGGASLLDNQTQCDSWGCYYNQRDSQWGRLAIGLSDSSMAEYGCLVTSMAMMATHYGKNLTPKDIALSSNPFWGNTAYMLWGSWTVNGVTTTRTRVGYGRSTLDAELAKGQPVVVGLYSGPDHFIVVKQKLDNDYLINDPFVPNGNNIKLTSKYPLSAIYTVYRVTVN